MEGNKKLLVIYKSLKAKEAEVLQEHRRIEQVLSERKKELEEIVLREQKLKGEKSKLVKEERPKAVKGGQASRVAGISAFLGRLEKNLNDIQPELLLKQDAVKRAQARFLLAESEVLEARVERKKVEKLMETKVVRERIQSEVEAEAALEERSVFKKNRIKTNK